MNRTVCAALVLAACLTTSFAAAQDAPTLVLSPADPSRWDAAVHVGWFGGNKSEIAPDWDDWYDAASFGVSAGYYWTPHLKLDVELGTTTSGGIFVQEYGFFGSGPYVQSREHTFRTTSLAGGVSYQFFENQRFHPFVGGGLAVVRERERLLLSLPVPRPPGVIPEPADAFEETSLSARPFAVIGFKAYASERVFFRSDVQVTGSRQHVESVSWRAGVGFDF
jgi:hypothetical protein